MDDGTNGGRRGGVGPVRVFIADDHPIVRRGLRQIVEDGPNTLVAGEAGSAREVTEQLKRVECDVLLLDLAMPGTTGLDLLERVVEEHPTLPVLVLTMQPEEQYAIRAIRAGAAGYMTKESAPDSLMDAIRRLAAGGRYVSASIAERLAFDLGSGREGRTPHDLLSNRELQVLCLLGKGQPVSEVGRTLHLSVKTVSTYRTRILEKLGMQTTADLIRYAIRAGLVD